MNARLGVACALAVLVWPAGRHPAAVEQPAPPQFRSAANSVEVFATVTDRTGRLVADLTQADFDVQDNGKTQPITAFEAGVQPITIAVMLDESPSLFESSLRVVNAVSAFNRSFLPGDRAMPGAFSHQVRLDWQLSRDLRRAIANIDGGRPRFPAGTAMWHAIDRAAKALSTETGRRVVLALTGAENNCSREDPEDVRARIERDGTGAASGTVADHGLGSRNRPRQ